MEAVAMTRQIFIISINSALGLLSIFLNPNLICLLIIEREKRREGEIERQRERERKTLICCLLYAP